MLSHTSADRRFVEPLLQWAKISQDHRQVKRNLLNTNHEFWPWLRSRVRAYYCFYFGPPTEFVEECATRLMFWARANVAALEDPAFNDNSLEGVLRTIASHWRADLRRERRKRLRRLERLDRYAEEWDTRRGYLSVSLRAPPESLRVPPQEWNPAPYPRLEEEFSRAQLLLPSFGRALRGKSRMRQLLAALLCLGRRLGKARNFPGHWFVFRLLSTRAKHLPKFVRSFLRKRFPALDYKVINARLGYLRRAFQRFMYSVYL